MIGRLRGQLLQMEDNLVLLEVGGVGYEVEVPAGTHLAGLPAALPPAQGSSGAGMPGVEGLDGIGAAVSTTAAEVTLHTHLVVREDAHLLYGFADAATRDLFRVLIRISGVGPKLALALLGALSGADLARCVAGSDVAALTRVPGIGKKTAERLLVELRNRQALLPSAPAVVTPHLPTAVASEVEQALVALGYKPQYATQVVQQVIDSGLPLDKRDTQSMLRAALKHLGAHAEVGS